MQPNINLILEEIKSHLDFAQIGISALNEPMTIDFYKKWLTDDNIGSMKYLADHFEIKKNPRLLNENLQSVISFTYRYYPAPFPSDEKYPVRTAAYSKNKDYHFWVKDKLNQAIETLKQQFPDDLFLPFVDSGPVLEKDWAHQSGLGWFGKNTCLIHPKQGSFFFIAEILSSIQHTEKNKIMHDFCGTCTQCMDSCPTGALIAPRVMKANHCISYLNIESKTVPPLELRSKMNDWFFGCDICQTVCPWNIKIHKDLKSDPVLKLTAPEQQNQILFFKEILTSSNKQLQKKFIGTPLFRAAGFGLKRNALVVIGNKKIKELQNEVLLLKTDSKLSELAEWCLQQLSK